MQVGIDARMINYSGIGRYIRSLLNEYSKMPDASEFFIFGDLRELGEYKHFKVKKSTAPIYSIGEQISLPLRIRKLPVFHSPHYNAPLFYRGKLIVTIQDIIHIKFPEYLPSRKAYLYARYMYRRVAEKAARLKGTLTAQIAAAGGLGSPVAADLAAELAAEQELENLLIGYESQVGAQRARSRKEMDLYQKRIYAVQRKGAKKAGYIGMGTTLLTGFGKTDIGKGLFGLFGG